jgi:NAD-dependent deacetylase
MHDPLSRLEDLLRGLEGRRGKVSVLIGTAGATTLPMQIGQTVSRNPDAVLIDVNPKANPFQGLARNHPNGIVLEGNSGDVLPKVVALWESLGISN